MNADLTPEARAAIWARLAEMANTISDEEVRAQYLATWRARYEAFAPVPVLVEEEPILPDGRLAVLTPNEASRLGLIGKSWWARKCEMPPKTGDALKRLAYVVGCRVRGGLLERDEALEALPLMIGDMDGVTPEDIASSFEAGHRRGFDAWPLVLGMRLSQYPLTDLGNAERFRDRFGGDFKYTTAKGWLGWDGKRWKVLDQEKDGVPAEVLAAVFDTIRAVQDEALAVMHTGGPSEENPLGLNKLIPKGKSADLFSTILAKWGRTSESSGKLGCIANLAKRWLTVPIEQFDVDPFAINVRNGTLRFSRALDDAGVMRAAVVLDAHRREDLNTKLAPVTYDRAALCPNYDDLIVWAQPDVAVRRYLHQWAGYSASGHVGEEVLHFWYGKGGNGKSTVIDAWAHALGDYSGTIGIETFLDQGIKKRGDAATPDLADLGGVRLLRASEPERGAKLNEALIKAATGGEPMRVRALFKGMFDMMPRFKLTISGNYRPEVPGTDEGIWRRLKLIMWGQSMAKADQDIYLKDKLKREIDGIFNYLVDGLIDWLEHGLVEPEAVTQATADYRDDSDPLARFLKMCVEIDPSARVQSSLLHEVFCAWAKAAGESEWKNKGFSNAMKNKGFRNKQSNGIQWLGLRLIKAKRDFVDEHGNVIEQVDDDLYGAPPDPSMDDDGGLEGWNLP